MAKKWGLWMMLAVICLVFAVPATAEKKRYTKKDWQDLSRAITQAMDLCAQKNFACFEKCRQQDRGDRNENLRCNRKCGEKFDKCVDPENQDNKKYKLLNQKALAQLEEDTDTCHEAYADSRSRCGEIDRQAQARRWDRCYNNTAQAFKKCLDGARQRFSKRERWPGLKKGQD